MQANEYSKAALAFEHVGGLVAADGDLDDFEHVGNVQSVARHLVAIQSDFQMLFACDLLDGQVFDAANA